jgi:hypothetical protein
VKGIVERGMEKKLLEAERGEWKPEARVLERSMSRHNIT